LREIGKSDRGDAMGRNACPNPIAGIEPLSGKRAIAAEFSRQPRQEPSCSNVGKEADADLRHGEPEPVTRDAMRAVDRDADATAHNDAVDQRT